MSKSSGRTTVAFTSSRMLECTGHTICSSILAYSTSIAASNRQLREAHGCPCGARVHDHAGLHDRSGTCSGCAANVHDHAGLHDRADAGLHDSARCRNARDLHIVTLHHVGRLYISKHAGNVHACYERLGPLPGKMVRTRRGPAPWLCDHRSPGRPHGTPGNPCHDGQGPGKLRGHRLLPSQGGRPGEEEQEGQEEEEVQRLLLSWKC